MSTTGTGASPSRPFTRIERALTIINEFAPLNLVVSVHTGGPTLERVLPAALADLQRRHPLLRAILDRPTRARGYTFPSSWPALPLSVDAVAATGDVRMESELRTPIDPRGPLARCTYSADTGQLLLTFHHAIADGPSAGAIVDELFTACRHRLDDSPAAPPAPPSADAGRTRSRVPERHSGWRGVTGTLSYGARQTIEEIGVRARSSRTMRPPPVSGLSRLIPIRLDRPTTDALVRGARRRRITVTSVLTAALLRLAAEHLGDRAPLQRALVWTDLRPHLHPPVPSSELGCHISMLRFVVPADTDVSATAARVAVALERSARRGDRFSALALSSSLARVTTRWAATRRMASAAVSYAPWRAPARRYGPITVESVSGAVSNHLIGAEVGAVAGVSDGGLWCNLTCLDSQLENRAPEVLGDCLRDLLASMT